jgi:DNA-binding NtrC family response regulator
MPSLSSSEKGPRGGVQVPSPSGISLRERVRQVTRQVESEIILKALEQHRWNRRRTAEALRISYRLLMYKMKTCNLRDDSPAPQSAADGNKVAQI